jgi:hypothetical protein
MPTFSPLSTAYEDWGDLGRKRHLLRLWLVQESFSAGDASLREGVEAPGWPAARRSASLRRAGSRLRARRLIAPPRPALECRLGHRRR